MTTRIKIVNSADLKKQLVDLNVAVHNVGSAMQSQAVEQSLMFAVKPILTEAKKQVFFRKGRLYASIARRKLKNVRAAGEIARVGVTVATRRPFKFAGSRWHWEEFGFTKRKKPLQPFFEPAFDSKKDEAFDRFVKAIQANLSRAVRGKMKLNKRWEGIVKARGDIVD